MKKIIIYCVTYNSYNETRRFLESVNVAALQAESSMISVIVIDNTEKDKETIFVDSTNSRKLRISWRRKERYGRFFT